VLVALADDGVGHARDAERLAEDGELVRLDALDLDAEAHHDAVHEVEVRRDQRQVQDLVVRDAVSSQPLDIVRAGRGGVAREQDGMIQDR